MPRPLRPCGTAGCPTLTRSSHCPEHQQETRRKTPEQERFYGSARWKRIRAEVRRQQPICVTCGRRPSAVVDHVDGNWTNNDRENLRGLCHPCNDAHTARQHRQKRQG